MRCSRGDSSSIARSIAVQTGMDVHRFAFLVHGMRMSDDSKDSRKLLWTACLIGVQKSGGGEQSHIGLEGVLQRVL